MTNLRITDRMERRRLLGGRRDNIGSYWADMTIPTVDRMNLRRERACMPMFTVWVRTVRGSFEDGQSIHSEADSLEEAEHRFFARHVVNGRYRFDGGDRIILLEPAAVAS